MNNKGFKTIDIVYAGAAAAVIAVCSWIYIPVGAVPVTLQTLAVCLTAALLGTKRGTLAVFIYILLGAVGVPVFSGFKGGIGALLGATGGYIIGFIFTALIVGIASDKTKKPAFCALAMVTGVLVCYAFGTAWFALIYMRDGKPTSLYSILSICVIPFIIPDAVKILVAAVISQKIKKFVKN